jgi:hypothetical protein
MLSHFLDPTMSPYTKPLNAFLIASTNTVRLTIQIHDQDPHSLPYSAKSWINGRASQITRSHSDIYRQTRSSQATLWGILRSSKPCVINMTNSILNYTSSSFKIMAKTMPFIDWSRFFEGREIEGGREGWNIWRTSNYCSNEWGSENRTY